MTECNKIQDRLAEEGAAVARRDDAIQKHVEGCAACSAFLKNLERVEAALLDLPEHDAPDSLVAETLGAVRQAQGGRRGKAGHPFLWGTLVGGLAATLMLFATVGILVGGKSMLSTRNYMVAKPVAELPVVESRSSEREQTVDVTTGLSSSKSSDAEALKDIVEGDRASGSKVDRLLPPPEQPKSVPALRSEEETEAPVDDGLSNIMQYEGTVSSPESEELARGAVAKNKAFAEDVAEADGDVGLIFEEDTAPAHRSLIFGNEQEAAGAGYGGEGLLAMEHQSGAPSQQYRGDEKKFDRKAEEPNLRAFSYDQLPEDFRLRRPEAEEEPQSQIAQLPTGGYLADEAYDEGRRRNLAGPGGPEGARLHARAFLARYASLEGLVFQNPAGYWANTYIPGDPAMRLLEARLRAGNAQALGQADPLEQPVQQVRQPFDAPVNAALAVYLQADQTSIQGPTRMRLQVGLKGAERHGGRRPAMNVGLVLDMRGLAKDGTGPRIRALVDALARSRQPGDRFSLTVAGPAGGLVVSPEAFRHGPISVAMARLFGVSGQDGASVVDLPQAVELASRNVRQGDDPGAILGSSLVLLATAGSLEGDLAVLEKMAHRNAVNGVPLSVVSLGGGTNPDDIDRLVAAGQGNRRVLDSAEAADALVDRELHASSRAVARAVRLRIRLAPGVKLIEVLGSRRLEARQAERVRQAEQAIDQRLARNFGIEADRGEDEEGIQIVIPSFYAGDSHVVLLDVVAERPGPVVDVTVRYKDLAFLKNGVVDAGLTIGGGAAAPGPLARNVLKNLVAWELSRRSRTVGQLIEAGGLDEARFVLVELRDLIHGLRLEVPGWSGDADLAADEEMLAGYVAALHGPALKDPAAQQFVADSLRFTAHRKQHSQAERRP